MTSGKPVKLILLFALPLIVGNIFQQFYSMADTVIVGRTIGVNALAAVGCTGSVSFFILGFVMGFTSGLSILIAQRFGAEDEEGIRCSFAAGIILSIALTIVMTFFAVALVRPAMEFYRHRRKSLTMRFLISGLYSGESEQVYYLIWDQIRCVHWATVGHHCIF